MQTFDAALRQFFGITNDGGALSITTTATTPLVATARTYNQTSNGTYGQFIPAVTANDAAALGTRPLQILQIEESDRYRTNVGFAEVTGKAAKIEVTALALRISRSANRPGPLSNRLTTPARMRKASSKPGIGSPPGKGA